MSAPAIETRYAGCRFRSRLEARWAVFFNRIEIPWEYEPQGFIIDGTPYLPDFLLPATGTWVEVKGDEGQLDHALMRNACVQVPPATLGAPDLLILGPIPDAAPSGEWAWLGFTATPVEEGSMELMAWDTWWSFAPGGAMKPAHETSMGTPASDGDEGWLRPAINMISAPDRGAADAYMAARSARFEHGEKG